MERETGRAREKSKKNYRRKKKERKKEMTRETRRDEKKDAKQRPSSSYQISHGCVGGRIVAKAAIVHRRTAGCCDKHAQHG